MNGRLALPACAIILSCTVAAPPKPHLYVSPSVKFVAWPASAMILPVLNFVPDPMAGVKTDEILFTLVGQSGLFVLENPSAVERALDEVDVEWIGTIDKDRLCRAGRKLGDRIVIAPVLRKFEEGEGNEVYIGLTIYDVEREEMLFYNEKIISASDRPRMLSAGAERTRAANLETAVREILRPFVAAAARSKARPKTP
ncbi:MAG: hypothetical protein A3G34_08490 [Candidatus Lindowbacteria bacterium RIFCSPLOWO2_12_FULL_62_27]|nr:MAG: hypothetical protein A3G34_08490 [Candidatus Lindowbacteria bacterium RIFCSPLOWO2_12_FULL_62_27]OGH62937.1 MAG: hypothetical protein A3I06_13735 [Candidatus Lindowbacteria bacterium RIFCSPLOWO2_02_FULL_62_12]